MVDVKFSDINELVLTVRGAMLDRCDGAMTEDGLGFNKFDACKVRSMDMTKKYSINSTAITLIKYKGQILDMGYDFETLLAFVNEIKKLQKEMTEKKTRVTSSGKRKKVASVIVDGDYITVDTPYNQNIISTVKMYKGRYNPTDKTWSVSIGYIKSVVEVVENIFGNSDNIILEVPDLSVVKAGEIFCNGIKEDVLIAMKYNSEFINELKMSEAFNFNRKWDNNKKAWRINVANKEVVDEIFMFAEKYNIGFSKGAESNLSEIIAYFDERIEMSSAESSEFDVQGLGGEMYPFQTAGVKFAEELGGRVLIADEMGLGKTIQALAWLQHHPEVRPAIIIVPNCVKENWRRETIKWVSTNNDTVVVNGGKDFTSGDITILNYDIVKKHKDAIIELNPQCIILDESHYIKNYKAQRTQAVQEICKGSKHIFALSGTPMLNRPIELWTIANMIAPNTFNNWRAYVDRYCNAFQDRYALNVNGSSNLKELQEKLRQTMMIRRLKTDVLTELPEKMRETVFMNVSDKEWSVYRDLESNFVNWLRENLKDGENLDDKLSAEALVKIGKLRKTVAQIKMRSAKEWVNNYMETSSGKLVLFCHHIETIEKMKEAFPDILTISGKDSADDRQASVDAFQNDDSKRLIVLTFGAGGVGLTLTKAQDVAFLELAWRPADLLQAEDRIHRIGQEGQVTAWYLLVPDSIDESMMEMINEKMKVSAMVLDKDAEVSMKRNLISSFLKRE